MNSRRGFLKKVLLGSTALATLPLAMLTLKKEKPKYTECDVYPIVVLSKDHWTHVPLAGRKVRDIDVTTSYDDYSRYMT